MLGMLTLAFNIQPVNAWTGTVYVRADGSIEPSDAPITTYDNVTYTLTDNITSSGDGIVVERDNIIVDGAGYTLEGTEGKGIIMSERSNVTIKNTKIETFRYGVWIHSSSNNKISDCEISGGEYGVYLWDWNCDHNTIAGNKITKKGRGIYVASTSYNNTILGNEITNCQVGVWLESSNNTVSGNSITEPMGGYEYGIRLYASSRNMISGNNIENHQYGIGFYGFARNNTISENNITNNDNGVFFLGFSPSDNSFSHNNFIGNHQQVSRDDPHTINIWDDGYPSGGNYWSDYNGTDLFSGPYQNVTGSDGIGDTPYVIEDNQDNYPLISPWTPVTLTVLGPWAGTELDKFLPVLEAFETQTGINVEYNYTPSWELIDLLREEFEAGRTPGDVIFVPYIRVIQEIGLQRHAVDVTDLIEEADFRPGALDQVKTDNKLYGASYTGSMRSAIWYRKSFFEANGLTVPTTWDEFVSLLETIKVIPGIENPIVSGDVIGWPLSDVTEHFLITYGGPQLHRDLIVGSVAWNSSTVRSIFADRLVPLLTAGYFSEPIEWAAALDLWWGGDYGLYFMGSWITTMVDDPADLGVFSLPGTEGLVFCADYFFIPTYTEHPDEAKQLFQFLASAEAQEIQVAQGGHIATNIHVPLDSYPPVDRRVAEVMEGMEVLPDLDDTIGGEFQTTFWDQLKLLWVDPSKLNDVLAAIQAVAPRPPADTTPPEITILSPQNMTYTNTSIPLTFAVNETTSWIGYSLDEKANVTIKENTTLTGLSEGTHSIVVYANDTSGNMGASETVYFTISLPYGPQAEFTAIPETANVDELVKFDASASLPGWNGTHEMPIVEYRWNFGDGNQTTTSNPIIYHSFSSPRIYYVTLTVYAPGATPETDSTTHKVTVISMPVGGYSFPIQVQTKAEPITPYIALITMLTAIFVKVKRKTKRKR